MDNVQALSGESTDADLVRAAQHLVRYEEVRIRMGRAGKSRLNAQGMRSLSWVPDGPDDTRPPRLPHHRLRMAKKLGQWFMKFQEHMGAPAAGPANRRQQLMEVRWPSFSRRMILDAEEADYGELEVYDWDHMVPADRDSDAPWSIGGWDEYVDRLGMPIPALRDRQDAMLNEVDTHWSVEPSWGHHRGRPMAREPSQPAEPIERRRATVHLVGGARDAAYRARSRMPGARRARRQCSNDPERAAVSGLGRRCADDHLPQ